MISNIIARILATFVATALSVIGSGAVIGVPTWQAAVMAGIAGVATVIERLARGFLDDGHLSKAEINAAFAAPTSEELKGIKAEIDAVAPIVEAVIPQSKEIVDVVDKSIDTLAEYTYSPADTTDSTTK